MTTGITLKEKSRKILEKFEVMGLLVDSCLLGASRSLIISGPPGIGKTYTVQNKLTNWDPTTTQYTIARGYVRATGLYKMLYNHRFKNNVLVLDDADSVFTDTTALNILKTVCDTTKERIVSWRSEATLYNDDGIEILPKHFTFEGALIYLTNIDFDYLVQKENKLSPHLKALMSRSHYIDLSIKSRQDFLVRIYQLINKGMLDPLPPEAQKDIMNYILTNHMLLRELSLRMVVKIKILYESNPNKWAMIANATCLKSR